VERERYDWSRPGEVRVTTLESTDFRPGGTWLYRAGPDAGSRTVVELVVDRRPVSLKGRAVAALGWFVAGPVLRRDLRRTLAVLEREPRGAS
jgi:hypothetical protein